jgi:hypothetical protein
LYDAFREHFGHDGDDVLFWKSPTRVMNPSVPESFIAAEIAKDPEAARAEYGAEFRDDISSFVTPEAVDAAIIKGRAVLAPSGESYTGFIDVSGGVHDSHTCAIAYRDGNGVAVLACAREVKSPDTEATVAEFAALLQSYRVTTAHADRYGAEWVRSAFDRHGIKLLKSPHDRSELYLNFLPQLNSGQVKLLDLPRLRQQLLGLERRTIRGTGRAKIDHPTARADDLVNAAAGALVMASRPRRKLVIFGVGPHDTADTPAIDYAELYREQAERAEEWKRDNPNDAANIDQFNWPVARSVRKALEGMTAERKPKNGIAYKAVTSFRANVKNQCALAVGHIENGELVVDVITEEMAADKATEKAQRYTDDIAVRTDCLDASRDAVSYLTLTMTGGKAL